MKRQYLMGLLAMLAAPAARGQEDSSARPLNEVVVTARRSEQKEALLPYSVQTLGVEQLDRLQPRTAPEALTGLSGVFVQKTNHGGGSPLLRGLTGNQTLLLVDGIRLNNSIFRYGPNQYFNTIDPYTIRKVEVAKGTGSVPYGSDALGGVIQVFTREPQFSATGRGWSARGLAKYLTGDMEKTARTEVAYQAPRTAVQAGATLRRFGHLVGGDTTGRQSPSGYRELAFEAKTRLLLGPGRELTVAHQWLQQQDVPVYHKVQLERYALHETEVQQRLLHYARLRLPGRSAWMQNLELIASWQQGLEERASRKEGSSTLRRERDEVNTLGFTADLTSRCSGIWTANSGIELYHDKVSSGRRDRTGDRETLLRGLYPNGARYGNYSLYSMHHLAWGKWVAEAGARYNIFSLRLHDTATGPVHLTPSALVGSAALLHRLTPRHHLYASVSSGFRAPNIDDLGSLGIVDFRYEMPATGLAPERSRSLEAGYKLRAPKVQASLSAYYLRLRDLIGRVKAEGEAVNGYPVYKKENVEEGYIKGVEAALRYDLPAGWQAQGSLAWTYGQNQTRNEPMRRMPPLNGRLISSYTRQGWFGAAEWVFASAQRRLAKGDTDDNRIPPGGTPGWGVVNLYMGYQFRKLKLRAGGQNLFNRDYRTHGSGINGVGRSGWLSFAVHL